MRRYGAGSVDSEEFTARHVIDCEKEAFTAFCSRCLFQNGAKCPLWRRHGFILPARQVAPTTRRARVHAVRGARPAVPAEYAYVFVSQPDIAYAPDANV